MANPRLKAILKHDQELQTPIDIIDGAIPSACFSKRVFNREVMQKMLPKEVFENVINAKQGKEKIKEEFADSIAIAMKEWAISHGATHYCHWFQPLTGGTAEKHDSFIEWIHPDSVIEKFSSKQLIQGEPDASSFPSGGLRTTFEARGYTGWDPTSPVFLWKAGDGITLCIPCVFFSWTGAVLDSKIPLLRSDKKINEAVLRVLSLTGIDAGFVYSTLGMEQEYFVIDKKFRDLRPDLLLLGRTVIGAPSPKGQELQDHYFGAVKDRILKFMRAFEHAAFELGIPLKTRHNEVAPAQHEVAPVFEKASLAIDHNILLMEIMRQIANKHGLSCLLHEKPFHDINGSGKHCNWSLATDTGINLLDPTDTPENNLHFLIILTAILHAIHKHSKLLRASIGSVSNDFRLGGHEAPPAILSVYLGKELETVLTNIEEKGWHKSTQGKGKYDLGLHVIPELTQDNTDRNRTSPFAFTGNKFEFRAVGSSFNGSFPITVLNTCVADSINEIMDKIEKKDQKKQDPEQLLKNVMPVLRQYITDSRGVRFEGDNYSQKWIEEAKKRKLPNIHKSLYAYEALKEKETLQAFEGILNKDELESRYEILVETYGHTLNIEARTIIDLFDTYVLPPALQTIKNLAKTIGEQQELLGKKTGKHQMERLKELHDLVEEGINIVESLKLAREDADSLTGFERSRDLLEEVFPLALSLRKVSDALEALIEDKEWALPKYREILYLV